MADLVLKWAWRYGDLVVDEFESLYPALVAAGYAQDLGGEAIESIEIVHEDGTRQVLGADEIISRIATLESSFSPAKPVGPVYVLCLKAPDGSWAEYERFEDVEEADRARDRLVAVLGEGRVLLQVFHA